MRSRLRVRYPRSANTTRASGFGSSSKLARRPHTVSVPYRNSAVKETGCIAWKSCREGFGEDTEVLAYSASLRCRSSRGVFPNKAPNAVEKCDPDENPHISPTCTIE